MAPEELESLIKSQQAFPEGGQSLAQLLVRAKRISSFQADSILAGLGKTLVMGNYVLLDKIGQGGMGMVFKAEHRRMERIVALKVLPPQWVKDADAVRRFHREVKAAARLIHPNIVTAFDADEAGGIHFLVMEFIDGPNLSSLVRSCGPLPTPVAVNCIRQTARGLEFAHSRKIVHRDIKPSNLLCANERIVKILDLGLARFESLDPRHDELTETGQIMGTIDFMAPEQAASARSVGCRADIYSLGVTLWYLLTGRILYEGDSVLSKIIAHREAPIPSLESNAQVSLQLAAVFQRMVAKRPDDRFSSMTQVLSALDRCPEISATPIIPFGTSLNRSTSSKKPELNETATMPRKAREVSEAVADTVEVVGAKTATDPKLQLPPFSAPRTRIIRHPLAIPGIVLAAALLFSFALVRGWLGFKFPIDKSRERLAESEEVDNTPASAITNPGVGPPGFVDALSPASDGAVISQGDDLELEFDGIDDRLEIPFGYDGTYPITIEGWVSPREPSARITTTILSNCQNGGLELEYGYGNVSDQKQGVRLGWIVYPAPIGRLRLPSNNEIPPGKRVHFAGVLEGKSARLFVNGKRQLSSTFVDSPVPSPLNFCFGANPVPEHKPNEIPLYKNQLPADAVPPIAVSSRLEDKGEEQIYRLNVTPGMNLRFSAVGQEVGSQLDAQLSVRNERGGVLASGDDLPGTGDCQLEFTVPEGLSVIQVAIRDAYGRGGANYVFRLEIRDAVKANTNPNRKNLFAGRIDEIRFSNQARYANDFQPPDRLKSDSLTLALYHCDETEGDVLIDSAHGKDAKVIGPKRVRRLDVK